MCTSSGRPDDRQRDARGLDAGGAIRHDERMTTPTARSPYLADMEAERTGWYRFAGLVRRLEPEERLEPGYYRDPDWSVRDLTAHIGTWLAEAQVQFERMIGGTYEGHDVDIDGLNDALLEAMHEQPWDVVWVQANSARTRMLEDWSRLTVTNDEAVWWIRKSAAGHYAEHLVRLGAWVDELVSRRDPTARA